MRALLRRVFHNYISFTTSLTSASQKTCVFYVNELSIGPCMCYTRRVSVIQLLTSPLTKWNLPVPCKLGRETRCVLQNRKGIFSTSELSFTRGFMNELIETLRFFVFERTKHQPRRNLRNYLVLQRLCNEAALNPGIDAFLY